MSEFAKALAALTTSLQQGAPHLRAIETMIDEAAPVVESIVPGSAALIGAVQGVEAAANAVVDTAQQVMTGAVTTPPVPPSLAMAQETVALVAQAAQVTATAAGVSSAPAPVPVPVPVVPVVPVVPLVAITAQPSLPDNAAPDLTATGGVDAATMNVAGVSSAAATPDQFAARLQTVETLLNLMAPVIADYAKKAGL